MDRGVVAEKTGFYSFLFLFSIGVTNGKSGTLLTALFEYKRAYDTNLPLAAAFPDLVRLYPDQMTMQDLCREMHSFLCAKDYSGLFQRVFDRLPE